MQCQWVIYVGGRGERYDSMQSTPYAIVYRAPLGSKKGQNMGDRIVGDPLARFQPIVLLLLATRDASIRLSMTLSAVNSNRQSVEMRSYKSTLCMHVKESLSKHTRRPWPMVLVSKYSRISKLFWIQVDMYAEKYSKRTW